MSKPTVLMVDASQTRLTLAITTIAAGLIGGVGPMVARWTQGISWLPFKRFGNFLIEVSGMWGFGGQILLILGGMLIGLIFGLKVNSATLSLQISDKEVVIRDGHDKKERYVRSQIDRVLLEEEAFDSTTLTFRDSRDADLFSEEVDFSVAEIEAAFNAHGWVVEIVEDAFMADDEDFREDISNK